MKTIPVFAVFVLAFESNLFSQLVFFEDAFTGGVTAAGHSPAHDGAGTGNFTISIPAGSTIRKAYLLAGRQGDAPDITVVLNSVSLNFNPSNRVTPVFQSPFYGGNSAVHAIDITSSLNPLVTSYSLTVPTQYPTLDRYSDFYLFVAYNNPALEQVNTALILDTVDFSTSVDYNVTLANPIRNADDVAIALFTGYACGAGDNEDIYFNSTSLGTIWGPDMNSGNCGGPIGSFYYENGILYGLSDDNADLAMTGPDALSNVKTLVADSSLIFGMTFEHGNEDNAVWGVVIAFHGSCINPDAQTTNDTAICSGNSVQLNASGGDSYLWSPQTGLSDPDIANPVASPVSTTTYLVTVFAGACSDTSSVNIVVNPLPVVSAGNDTSINSGTSVQLVASGGINYLWDNGTTTDVITVSPTQTTTYNVTATGTSGCKAAASVTITVLEPRYFISVPSIFSPNADGINDFIRVHGNGISEFHLEIYDRWGEKITETSDLNFQWDGTFGGKILNASVFVYFLNAIFTDGTAFNEKGNITLVR